ncbi:chaperone CsaA [Alkalicoccus chagannorensis]|uniref:chaperone CsaA n=1 Tax=Alkalicoccus chagannorensis TaxID=427072 RepID=UPI00040863F5|nr:chaperone CsaA [Alkalicoccus chagannorensis]
MAVFEDFQKLDLRTGTVLHAGVLEKARVPAITMEIDFGDDIGVKQTSAQITKRYDPDTLIGRQVIGIVNFPPRKIAGFTSEVLVLGGMPGEGDVVLLQADEALPNGTPIG